MAHKHVQRPWGLGLFITMAFVITGCLGNDPSQKTDLFLLNVSNPAVPLEVTARRSPDAEQRFDEVLPFGQLVNAKPLESGVWNFTLENQTRMPAEQFRYGLGKDASYLLVLYGFNQETPFADFDSSPDLWKQSSYEEAKSFLGGMEVVTSKHFLLQQKLIRLPPAKPDAAPKLRLAVFSPGKNEFIVDLIDKAGTHHQSPPQGFSQVSDWLKINAGETEFSVRYADSPAQVGNGTIELPQGSVTTFILAGESPNGLKVLIHQWKDQEATMIYAGKSNN
ncbi:hypothetical protein AB1L30_09015 [Bremerella sp. JC817]|uniref:hypothetical protein n=1 Tax=Bremerella sp. JC817 TaxID=3231756 RepID=UPI00345AABD8